MLFVLLGVLLIQISPILLLRDVTYTRHKMQYFFSVFSIGVLYSVGVCLVNGSLRQSVLITFSCSIALIFLLAQFRVSDKKHLVAKLSWLFSFYLKYILYLGLKRIMDFGGLLRLYWFGLDVVKYRS